MTWILILLAYFFAAALLGLAGTRLRRAAVWIGLVPFLAQLAAVVAYAGNGDEIITVGWVPSLGLELTFAINALSLTLSSVVAGIGALIVLYTWRYFGSGPKLNRFLALVALFTGGMAGIVSSDHLFGLFLFWEVTTVASYLLIGFEHDKAQARVAALQAILVTAAGGLAMLAGFVILTIESGTASITELSATQPGGTAVTVAVGLVLLGAFTKSAQFPFHFWLPGAMAAPTPASAYLHSATMVKAGIILLILLAPAFAGLTIWSVGVTVIGLTTMLVGGIAALGQHDLKLLLAHSTVSQLGFMTALIGLDLIAPAMAILIAHAVFKAGLFLITGVIDKTAGTRDIRQISGLGRKAPLLAASALLLTLSMAGIPPVLGFAAKEAAFDSLLAADQWPALIVIAIGSVITVAYSARYWRGAFGTAKDVAPVAVEANQYPVMSSVGGFLAAITLALGLYPNWLGNLLETATGQKAKVVLWPGLTTALAVSAAVVAAGAMTAAFLHRRDLTVSWRGPTATGIYRASLRGLNQIADRLTGIVQNGSLPVYLAVIMLTVAAVPSALWLFTWDAAPSLPVTNGLGEVVVAAVVIVAAFGAARAGRRMAAVLMLGVVGYSVAGIYVLFGAPDLALTQLLVETLTIALFALVLVKLPRSFGSDPKSLARSTRLLVAAAVGLFATLSAVVISSVNPARDVANAYIDKAVDAGGTNVVNIILTNFRALDTLGEITVLAAAATGISALVAARKRRGDSTP